MLKRNTGTSPIGVAYALERQGIAKHASCCFCATDANFVLVEAERCIIHKGASLNMYFPTETNTGWFCFLERSGS